MVLEDYRDQADPYLNPIAQWLVRTHPNTMTWLAFAFAVMAGAAFLSTNFMGWFATYMLFLCAAFIFFNAVFDALDGKVARLAKLESKRGDFLDHVLDRYADFFIIGGITVSPFCDFRIGILAILGVFFASYMGTQAQAVGIKRNYGGLLARADRLVLLCVAPLVQMALEVFKLIDASHRIDLVYYNIHLSIIEFVMIWFAIAGNTTAIQRAWTTWNDLKKKEAAEGAQPAVAKGESPSGPEPSKGTLDPQAAGRAADGKHPAMAAGMSRDMNPALEARARALDWKTKDDIARRADLDAWTKELEEMRDAFFNEADRLAIWEGELSQRARQLAAAEKALAEREQALQSELEQKERALAGKEQAAQAREEVLAKREDNK